MAEEIKTEQPKAEPAKPAASSSTSSSQSSGGGNKGCTTAIIIIVIILAVLGIGSYIATKYFAGKIAEKGAESLIGAATGGKVDINSSDNSVKVTGEDGSVELGSSKWPDSTPSVVPKFTYGNVTGSLATTEPAGWTITFEQVDSDAYEKYQKDLQRAGFVTKEQLNTDNVRTTEMAHVDWEVLFSTDSTAKTASITISEVAK